jgi:hypothetical protein
MADATFVNPRNNLQLALSFGELVSLIKGTSIKSMAFASDFFEVGTSDAFNLRIQGQFQIFLMYTLNKGEFPPLRLKIAAESETPTAQAVERRIHSLRQLYALAFLVDNGRSKEIAKLLEQNASADLEDALQVKDRLLISAAGEGSFWLTVLAKTKGAFGTLQYIAPLFYEEGREAILRRIKAGTKLKELEVSAKELQLTFEGANKLVDLVQKVEKIKDAATRQKVQQALSSNAHALGKQLPPALPSPQAESNSKLPAPETKAKRKKKKT